MRQFNIVPPVLLRCTFPYVFPQADFTPRMHASAVLHLTAGLLFNSRSFSSLTCSHHTPGTVLLSLLVFPVIFLTIFFISLDLLSFYSPVSVTLSLAALTNLASHLFLSNYLDLGVLSLWLRN